MEIYVKATSNYPQGLPLLRFDVLSATWEGESVSIPFGEERRHFQVVGWTDLFMGRPCPVKVARARTPRGEEGFLVWGGNSGLRVLDDRRESEDWEAHLPPGWGMPMIWVDDPEDLPEEVRAAIVTTAVVNHAHPLTNGLVGAWLFNDGQAVQVDGQTVQMEEEDPLEPEDIDQRCWPKARVRNPKGTY